MAGLARNPHLMAPESVSDGEAPPRELTSWLRQCSQGLLRAPAQVQKIVEFVSELREFCQRNIDNEATVEMFGSTGSGLAAPCSDVDVSIDVPRWRDKVSQLQRDCKRAWGALESFEEQHGEEVLVAGGELLKYDNVYKELVTLLRSSERAAKALQEAQKRVADLEEDFANASMDENPERIAEAAVAREKGARAVRDGKEKVKRQRRSRKRLCDQLEGLLDAIKEMNHGDMVRTPGELLASEGFHEGESSRIHQPIPDLDDERLSLRSRLIQVSTERRCLHKEAMGLQKRLDRVKADQIRALGRELRSSRMIRIEETVAFARVPVLKCSTKKAGSPVKVDICIGNRLAVRNTKLLKEFARVSPGVELFLVLVKRWSKLNEICDASVGNLSSYGQTILALIFLRHFGGGPWIPDLFPERLFVIDPTDASASATVSKAQAKEIAAVEGRILVDETDSTFYTLDQIRGLADRCTFQRLDVDEVPTLVVRYFKFLDEYEFTLHTLTLRREGSLSRRGYPSQSYEFSFEDPFECFGGTRYHDLGSHLHSADRLRAFRSAIRKACQTLSRRTIPSFAEVFGFSVPLPVIREPRSAAGVAHPVACDEGSPRQKVSGLAEKGLARSSERKQQCDKPYPRQSDTKPSPTERSERVDSESSSPTVAESSEAPSRGTLKPSSPPRNEDPDAEKRSTIDSLFENAPTPPADTVLPGQSKAQYWDQVFTETLVEILVSLTPNESLNYQDLNKWRVSLEHRGVCEAFLTRSFRKNWVRKFLKHHQEVFIVDIRKYGNIHSVKLSNGGLHQDVFHFFNLLEGGKEKWDPIFLRRICEFAAIPGENVDSNVKPFPISKLRKNLIKALRDTEGMNNDLLAHYLKGDPQGLENTWIMRYIRHHGCYFKVTKGHQIKVRRQPGGAPAARPGLETSDQSARGGVALVEEQASHQDPSHTSGDVDENELSAHLKDMFFEGSRAAKSPTLRQGEEPAAGRAKPTPVELLDNIKFYFDQQQS